MKWISDASEETRRNPQRFRATRPYTANILNASQPCFAVLCDSKCHVVVVSVSHLTRPPVGLRPPPLQEADGLSIWVRESLRCRGRRLLCGFWTSGSAGEMTTHGSPCPALWRVNIQSFHPVQLPGKSTDVKRLGKGSQEADRSNLFPCQLPSSPMEFFLFRPLPVSLSLPPRHLFLPFLHPLIYFFSFPFFFSLSAVRKKYMIYEALFLPVTEEKDRRKRATKNQGGKRLVWEWGRRWGGVGCQSEPQGGRRTGDCGRGIHHLVTCSAENEEGELGWGRKCDRFEQDQRFSARWNVARKSFMSV